MISIFVWRSESLGIKVMFFFPFYVVENGAINGVG